MYVKFIAQPDGINVVQQDSPIYFDNTRYDAREKGSRGRRKSRSHVGELNVGELNVPQSCQKMRPISKFTTSRWHDDDARMTAAGRSRSLDRRNAGFTSVLYLDLATHKLHVSLSCP